MDSAKHERNLSATHGCMLNKLPSESRKRIKRQADKIRRQADRQEERRYDSSQGH